MSDFLGGIQPYNTAVSQSATETKAKDLQHSLSNLKGSSDEELMDVCKSFESYFLEQVFKSMEKTIMEDKNSATNSGATSYFKDMLTQKYAENATQTGGYGIAQQLYESMKRQLNE